MEFYHDHGGGTAFTLLFVSADKSAGEMQDYMTTMAMPWVATAWHGGDADAIEQQFAGTGIPDLVLLNAQDQVLSDSYDGETYLGPQHVLDDYLALGKPADAAQ